MYVYYLMTRRDFTSEGHFQTLTHNSRRRMMARSKFDADLHDRLLLLLLLHPPTTSTGACDGSPGSRRAAGRSLGF